MKRLEQLSDGDIAIIKRLHCTGEYSKRLSEMGFIKGRRVKVIKNAPMNAPIEYELMGYSISLRRNEARMIEVAVESEVSSDKIHELTINEFIPVRSEDLGIRMPCAADEITIAIIGNPNCGKTTLFNYVSGLDEHVGNFSGITVELKEAIITHKGTKIKLVDLPGTYSLSTYSPEEKVVRDELLSGKYDFVLNVVDSTLLERNLYLTTQLMDMGCHMVVALNMYDELEKSGDKFDHEQLGVMLDIPLIPTSARSGAGIDKVLDMIVAKYDGELPHSHIESNHGDFIEVRVASIAKRLEKLPVEVSMPRRYLALSLIEGDESLLCQVGGECAEMATLFCKDIEKEYKNKIAQVLADARYGYVAGALAVIRWIGSTQELGS